MPLLLPALRQIKGDISLNLKPASEQGSVVTGPTCLADKLSDSMTRTGLRQTARIPVESLPAPLPGHHHFFLSVVTPHWLHFPPVPFLWVHQTSLWLGEKPMALRTENIPC